MVFIRRRTRPTLLPLLPFRNSLDQETAILITTQDPGDDESGVSSSSSSKKAPLRRHSCDHFGTRNVTHMSHHISEGDESYLRSETVEKRRDEVMMEK